MSRENLDHEIQRLKVLLDRAGYEVTIRRKPEPIQFNIDIQIMDDGLKQISEAVKKFSEELRRTLRLPREMMRIERE